jgi:D-alanyl-D-alanine-carboxypeptidase/D-alanyl-D-alanine-endopeptidase
VMAAGARGRYHCGSSHQVGAMRIAAALLPALLLSSSASLAQPPVPGDAALQGIAKARVASGRHAGVVIALLRPDGSRSVVAAGTGAGGAPLRPDAVFEIGSITKAFTGVLLAQMALAGDVRLDQPVRELLPAGSAVPARDGREITLGDLSTQVSGLPPMPTNFAPRDPANPYADYDGARLLAFLRTVQPARAAGERYEYSNLGVGLLGYALSAKGGASYEQLLAARVLRPLGLRETVVQLSPALRARLAPGHDAEGNPAANWDLDALAGAGALRSSAGDMLTFLAANVAAARDSTKGPLARALALSHRRRATAGSPVMGIGLGWHRLAADADTAVWHNGGTGGYRTFAGFNPATGVAVAVFTNTSTSVDDIGVHLLLGRPLRPPPSWPAVAALDGPTLQRHVGRYALTPAITIEVTRTTTGGTDGLRVQLTGQAPLSLYPTAVGRFFLKAVDAQLEFELPADGGSATAVTLVQNGARQRAARLADPR